MGAKNPWVLPDGFDDNVAKALEEVLAAFKRTKQAIPKEALEALKQGNWLLFQSIIQEANLGSQFAGLESILRATASNAAVSMYQKAGAGAKLTFDIIDEYSVNYASTRTGFLIKEISEEMRLNIERTITEATLGDITGQEAAEQISEYIPLTARDAGAVRKYHERMLKKYIDRKGWNEKAAKKYAKSLSDKYAEKLTKSRARTIARTEIAEAAMQGQYIGWEAGMQSGQLDSDSLKEWIAEPNACEYCGAIDGKTVRWDENFEILGGKLMPPAHPNCRCAVAMLPPDYADTPFTAQAIQKSKGWWNQFEIEFAKHLAGKYDQSNQASSLSKAIIDFEQASKLAKAESYKPTQGMVAAAKRALRWKEEGKATGAGTPVGWGRASDIVAGRSMSLSVVTRMYSFFSRHEVDKKGKDFNNTSNPSNGRIMWEAWGGDAGFTWSKAIVERAKKLEKHLAGKHDQSTHGRGGASHSTDRPYQLKSRFSTADGYKIPYNWFADASLGRGPDATILAYGSGNAKRAAQLFLAERAIATQNPEEYVADIRDNLKKQIMADPDYPSPPKNIQELAIANRSEGFYDTAYGRENLISDSIEQWAKTDPAAAAAYLAKENAFVESKLRELTFANGQTVGEVFDGLSQSMLDQMQEIAINNRVSLTMPAGKLKKFIAEDHYRTAAETTLTGKGANRAVYMERRDEFEFDRMGIPTMTKDSERPVYGVIGRSGKEVTYGDTQVIFKDDVKHRTTATIGDSLDGSAAGVSWLEDYANGDVSIDDLWNRQGQLLINTFGNNRRSGDTFTWQKDSSGEEVWGGITGYKGKADLREIAEYGYIETQIHGGLKLADVAQIVIPSPTSIPKATQAMLTDRGIEVIVGSHLEKSRNA